jgi:hypothetical protein
LLVFALATPSSSARPSDTSAAGPDQWDVKVNSLPVLLRVSVPPALPLEVTAGVGFAGIQTSTQPLTLSTAAPVYAPIIDALGLLGGVGAVVPIATKLVPSLIAGFPTIFGLPPTPIDPGLFPPLPPLTLPSPPLPVVQCTAFFPGDPHEVTCGGPAQSLAGFEFAASSGTATTMGDANKPDTLAAESAARVAGLRASSGNTLTPISIGGVASAAQQSVQGPAVFGSTSVSLTDINLFGVIAIKELRDSLSASLTGRPGEQALQREVCNISGLTVAGVPMTIGTEGLHVADQSLLTTLGSSLSGAVSAVLAIGNTSVTKLSLPLDVGQLEITLLPPTNPTIGDDGNRIEAAASCLQVRYFIPASGSALTVVLGQSTLSMSARRLQPFQPASGSGGSTALPSASAAAPAGYGSTAVGNTAGISAVQPGAIAPAPSTKAFVRAAAQHRIDWTPVMVALAIASWAVLAAARGRRAVYRRVTS